MGMCVALGGRIAEELIFGAENVTTGASGDFQQVTRTAKMMVTQMGFSDELGQVSYGGGGGPASSSSMRSMPWEGKEVPVWAVAMTRESRPSTSSSRRWMDSRETPGSSSSPPQTGRTSLTRPSSGLGGSTGRSQWTGPMFRVG